MRQPPAAGAAVMATGIVSIGLRLTGHTATSRAALAIAAGWWLLLAASFAVTFAVDRDAWLAGARTPPALTAVAATTVVGARVSMLGWQPLAAGLLALAALALPGLLAVVIRHWPRRVPGSAFLVCVAPQGVAVLAATLARTGGAGWLAWPAAACFCLGLALYVFTLARFDPRQVLAGAGDHWIAAGAIAISTLAAVKLTPLPRWSETTHAALRTVTIALIAADLAWYAVLVAAEIARPRLGYDVRRWATVFPIGMSAVAARSAAPATGVDWLRTLGHVLLWVAAAAWLATAAGMVAAMTRSRRRRVAERREPEPPT